ncbi:MAG TPA: ABC transporter ATP-binding protein [Steroidobacteraceae bacterium]|nr:ABC transporter ATP-binding protein [Steroidobacteraceae bacterium]
MSPHAPQAALPAANTQALLRLRQVRVSYRSASGEPVPVVRGVDLDLAPGEILGLAGESGCGKTQLLLSILGLNGPQAQLSGSVNYRGRELLGLRAAQLNAVRGARIAMVFQDPVTALNPYLRIGTQLIEVLRSHAKVSGQQARERACEMLEAVQIGDARRRLSQYPHELSGGMRQRVVIAMALMASPEILLADEPTTALDVTVQAQILSLLRQLCERHGIAVLLVTHDMGVIAELADRVALMYAGRIVEQAPVDPIFDHPLHPYSEALQECVPRLDGPPPRRLASIPGAPPDPAALPSGCAFAPRCAYRLPVCDERTPELLQATALHWKACHYEGPLGRLRDDTT